MHTISSEKELPEAKLVHIYKNDSIFFCAKDTSVFKLLQNLNQSVSNLEHTIKDFKVHLPVNAERIWIKTMNPDQKESYKKYEQAYHEASEARSAFLMHHSNSSGIHSIVKIEAYNDKTTKDYLGIFYFNDPVDPYKVTDYYLFPMKEALELSSLYTQSTQNGQLPTLDKEGIDVVPEDEDPTKTPEERARIKSYQRQLEENKKNRFGDR